MRLRKKKLDRWSSEVRDNLEFFAEVTFCGVDCYKIIIKAKSPLLPDQQFFPDHVVKPEMRSQKVDQVATKHLEKAEQRAKEMLDEIRAEYEQRNFMVIVR